ncbi:permease [Patescibacteria group bacterium]|nr:permease [Candidatus Falkowbacteria bacterium]MBU3906418.1 permease [Patescibacteria group bacterium]MBU4014875.1 permease [Patescibacteria group bacterium]MBU4026848.1 permease [Patescibacteria group bacterium]MBU4073613.1 permease [Patescibacteria group bacterium]
MKFFILLTGLFFLFYFMPMESSFFTGAVLSGLKLLNKYAREHVLTCLLPAFFIAGAISVFIKKDFILRYLGGQAKKYIAYSLASVSGAILAVCSCTILPLFAGIRKRGAGLGPASAFLFSGPAINIAAIFLTMSVLGHEIGLARIISAVLLSILVGLSMQFIFKEKIEKGELFVEESKDIVVSKKTLIIFFGAMIGILVVNGLQIDKTAKYLIMILLALAVAGMAIFKFQKETSKEWLKETWSFTKMLLPVLFIGVFTAGFIMPFLPQSLIERIVGANTISGNLAASIFGAFMYFSTLTEIPISQALIAKGMSQGPALALLLAGPSLSLPNMLVIRKILGNKKTAVYVSLVVFYSTIAGLIFGSLV